MKLSKSRLGIIKFLFFHEIKEERIVRTMKLHSEEIIRGGGRRRPCRLLVCSLTVWKSRGWQPEGVSGVGRGGLRLRAHHSLSSRHREGGGPGSQLALAAWGTFHGGDLLLSEDLATGPS